MVLVLVRGSTPGASFYGGDTLTLLSHIGLVRSFSYTPHANFSEEFLSHS